MTSSPISKTIFLSCPMKNFLFPALLTISAGFSVAFPSNSYSQSMAACGDVSSLSDSAFATTHSGGCAATPDKYEIVIYEMGLCTGATSPIASGTLDRGSCATTFTSALGQTVDLAGSASRTLDASSSSAPSPATYTWGYMVMQNTFGLNGSLQTGDNLWVSTSDGTASRTDATASDFSESLTNFSSEEGGCDSSASADMSAGTMSAILTDTDLVEVTSCSAADISRLVGAFSPNTAYTITDSTTALQITFEVTNNGLSVLPPFEEGEPGVGVGEFGSGPFQMTITTIE